MANPPDTQLLHKALYQQLSITILSRYLTPEREIRQYHPQHFILPYSSTTSHQNSYILKPIKDWNSLSARIIEIDNPEQFLLNLQEHVLNG